MHGRERENWKRRRRHMFSVPDPAPQATTVVEPSSSSPADSSIQSSVDSFLKDGRKIRVGDCALFQAGNAPPFIGIIRWFTISKEDCLKLCVNWLYRPADVKLAKGIILEAAPNEVFYSFHKDVISAASLLHPCKVAFLGKGAELPSGISSFVCRRVYDIANKCLWWLTDQNYINVRQEEVDQLLDKTRLEMHAAVQSGGRSPKPLNGSASTQQLKSSNDSAQNSGASFPSQSKGKKRDRGGDQVMEPIKRERSTKPEDGESASSKLDSMIKSEIAKITEKGALLTTESVEKLVHLIQLDRNERKIDLVGRISLADLIAATDKIESLARFVQLRGVPVLDDWLQEAHKGKIGDSSSPKESDKSTDELLLALLRALDKLPVNLNALQTCNIGKSVNHLRGHKNLDIQRKARSLVDTWKKRVDAEMTKINDAKSCGSNQAFTWPVKPGFAEVSRRSGSAEAAMKTPITQTSTCKTLVGKTSHADVIVKSTPVTPGSLKLPSSLPASVPNNLRDSPGKGAGSSGNSEVPLAAVKEEKSSGSSQSQNNSQSCSSDHAKTMISTAGSVNAKRHHRRLSNGYLGSGVQKEANLGKTSKVSSELGVEHGNNHRLIVRIPNTGRSHARSASGGPIEDPTISGSRASSPGAPDKSDHIERKIKLKGDVCRSQIASDVNGESWHSNDVKDGMLGPDEGERSPPAALDEETERAISTTVNGKGGSVVEATKSRNAFSSMNALVESCAKYSEASASLSSGDDVGINLLANVAAGEISKSDSGSPGGSPKEEPCSANEAKSSFSCEDGGAQNRGHSDENTDLDSVKQETSKIIAPKQEDNLSNMKEELEGDVVNQSAVVDNKTLDYTCEKIAEGSTKASDVAGNCLGDGRDSDIPGTCIKPEKLEAESSLSAPLVKEASKDAALADEPQPLLADNHTNAADKYGSDAMPLSIADKAPPSEIADACNIKKSDEVEDGSLDHSDGTKKEQTGLAPSNDEQNGSAPKTDEKLERKESLDKCPVSCGHEAPSSVPTQESEHHLKSPDVEASEAKLDFDLNEGFSGDDETHTEPVTSAPLICSPAIPLTNLSPFAYGPKLNGSPAPITAAPAKGPFVPPENLLKSKGEPGWKGSAATSAFRPAEPRKVLEMPLNTSDVHLSDAATSKQVRSPLDIDLNVADDRGLEDLALPSSPQTTGSESGPISNRGLDLDLNRADEGTDNWQFLAGTSSKLKVPLISTKRGFDLNNGPGLDEVAGVDTHPKSQHAKNSSNSNLMPFLPQFSGLRMGNVELGNNISSWFPPGNSYPAVAIPSFLSDRGEQQHYPIVALPGTQRILGSVTGAGTAVTDVYRGPVLSSSPAMTFPHTTFPYASFPLGSNFPITSNFSGGSTTFVDSSFPAVPSQLAGPAGAVSSHFPRPYMVSLGEGSMSAGSESGRKWGRQGFDLNAGPGSGDADVKDEHRIPSGLRQLPVGNPHAFLEEQARMYQVSGGGGGVKRKDREGGSWDERFYKQPSWQ